MIRNESSRASPFRSTTSIDLLRSSTAANFQEFNSISSTIRHSSIATLCTELRWETITTTLSALRCSAVRCLRLRKILGVPDVFHCHDWQSALIPVLLRTLYDDDPAFSRASSVFTIHNIGYQGLFAPDMLPLLQLPWELFTITKLEFYGKVNFLKGALSYADFITTVSRKYAHEIQTSEYGFGLEGVLRSRSNVITGILNGVDYNEWSPSKDKFIAAPFDDQVLNGKQKDKEDLLKTFGADPTTKLPVIGIVSRFAAQKGFDLISSIADRLAREEVIVVALGSGDKEYEEMFARLDEAVSDALLCEGGIRQRHRAQDRSRSGYVPHAVSLRALRIEPDLQSEIRHRADRARNRWSRRYDRALGPGDRQGNRV